MLLFSFLFSLYAQPNPEPIIADRIVLVIQEKTITESEIALERDLATLIPSSSTLLQYYRPISPQRALIQVTLLRLQAGELNPYQARPAEIEKRFDVFRAQWSEIAQYYAFLNQHGLTDERLLSYIKTLIIAENYIEKNLGLANSMDLEEARTRFEQWEESTIQNTRVRFVSKQD